MGRGQQILAVVAWAVLAAFLFGLFGFFFAHAVASTLVRVGVVADDDSGLVGDLARVAVGLGLLGIAFVYRRLAGAENAGSLAAWLAGWGLLLYSLSSLASAVDEQAGPVVLVVVLGVWVGYRLMKHVARWRAGGPDGEE
jgi:hypothetical protein